MNKNVTKLFLQQCFFVLFLQQLFVLFGVFLFFVFCFLFFVFCCLISFPPDTTQKIKNKTHFSQHNIKKKYFILSFFILCMHFAHFKVKFKLIQNFQTKNVKIQINAVMKRYHKHGGYALKTEFEKRNCVYLHMR